MDTFEIYSYLFNSFWARYDSASASGSAFLLYSQSAVNYEISLDLINTQEYAQDDDY